MQSVDAVFSEMRMLVKLERSENKNRDLDRRLDELKGQRVSAKGFLDCRRAGQEQGVIYLYLQNQSQISRAED